MLSVTCPRMVVVKTNFRSALSSRRSFYIHYQPTATRYTVDGRSKQKTMSNKSSKAHNLFHAYAEVSFLSLLFPTVRAVMGWDVGSSLMLFGMHGPSKFVGHKCVRPVSSLSISKLVHYLYLPSINSTNRYNPLQPKESINCHLPFVFFFR